MNVTQATDAVQVSTTTHRVNYSETDQMGVVYHARYLVWLDIGRTEHLRVNGMSYRELEQMKLRLVVSDLRIKYRRAARYDDPVLVRTWVRELASRRVSFGYAVDHGESGQLLATASTELLVLDERFQFARLPAAVVSRLISSPDPVRL